MHGYVMFNLARLPRGPYSIDGTGESAFSQAFRRDRRARSPPVLLTKQGNRPKVIGTESVARPQRLIGTTRLWRYLVRPRTMGIVGAVVASLALLASATGAIASEHYCVGNLQAKWACAHGNAHTVDKAYVEIITNHTGCAGLGTGFGGYKPPVVYAEDFTSVACTNGSGTSGGTRISINGAHGAVYNPNSSTTDYVYDAHISWCNVPSGQTTCTPS